MTFQFKKFLIFLLSMPAGVLTFYLLMYLGNEGYIDVGFGGPIILLLFFALSLISVGFFYNFLKSIIFR
jgi:hypothetical protein